METRSQALKGVFATWKARLLVGVPVGAGVYQFGCDQFDWPKLPALWGMTGQLIPWWGWLIVALAGSVFALFEYVRRNINLDSSIEEKIARCPDDPTIIDLEQRLLNAETAYQKHAKDYEDASSERADLLEKTLAAALPVEQRAALKALHSEKRMDILHRLEGYISQACDQHANDFTPISGLSDIVRRTLDTTVQQLVFNGVDQEQINAAFAAIENEIKLDSKYLPQNDAEREKFTGDDGSLPPEDLKRQWHVREKRLAYLRELISGMEERERSNMQSALGLIRLIP